MYGVQKTYDCPAPGPQVFESKGQVKVTRRKRKFCERSSSIGGDEQNFDISEQLESSQAPRANERNCVARKQSGVPGVTWNACDFWTATWYEEKKRKFKHFHVRHFMNTGNTYSEAEADALRAAIKFRKGLERSGIAKAGRAEKPQSGAKGVTWDLQRKSWKVSLRINDKQRHGGYFKPKDSTLEEVERARLAALESRRKLEEKYICTSLSRRARVDG